MAVAFHTISPSAPRLACESCGCEVDPSESGRALHQQWHDHQDQQIIDLTAEQEARDRR